MIKSFFYREDKEINGYLNKRPGKDAGYDLYAAETKWFWPLQTKKINSNGSFHVPAGHFGRITSRSGHSSKGWMVHPGTIDHGYSGVWGIIKTNLSFLPRRIKKGTRIAQVIFLPFSAVEFEEIEHPHDYAVAVEQDSKSNRGSSGFGDSGIA